MKNKNIWKKIISITLLAATIIFLFGSTFPINFNSDTQKPKPENVKLEESDKIKLNKKIQTLGFVGSLKVSADEEIKDPVVVGELLVKFKDVTQKESFVRENIGDSVINLSLVTKISTTDKDEKETLDTLTILKNDSRIEWAEPNILIRKSFVPNDSKYNDQWALKNIGQPNLAFYNPYPTITNPTAGFDIKAEQAWNVNTGNGTVIAIIDDGVDYNHPDLATNIFRDSGGRIIGKNIADNCFYSNSNGTDNTSCNYQNVASDPSYGHGTAVAGAAAAKGNNSSGISGACPNCRIMPIGLEGVSGVGTINSTTLYDGMVYAMNNGAKVINMSLGFDTYLSSIASLVTQAYNNNILIVASSGNCGLATLSPGCTNQNQFEYPASFSQAISVSGTNPDGHRADFATVNNMVDISGPARNIWTTWSQYTQANCGSSLLLSGGSYLCYESGTSFSSPITAGVLGLILGQNPSFTYSQAETALKNGSTNTYVLNPSLVGLMGAGDVNACGALTGCSITNSSSNTSSTLSLSTSSQSNTFAGNININFCLGVTTTTVVSLSPFVSTNNLNVVSQLVPSGAYTTSSNLPGNLNVTFGSTVSIVSTLGPVAGSYNLVVQESNNLGNVGGPREYNVIYNVINCSSSSSTTTVPSSSVSSSNALTSSLVSSTVAATSSSLIPISSSSLLASSSLASSSSQVFSSSVISSSIVSSSLISSSTISSSSTSAPYSFGSFLPNAPLPGIVGSTFPTFALNACNLPSGATPVTISTGANSISGTFTNCIFTPNLGQLILPAFQTVSTLTINSAGVSPLVIPVIFTLPIVSSSSQIASSSSILSSSLLSSSVTQTSISVISSSQISSSSIALPSVAITGINVVGYQYQISFVPTNYVPTLGGIHTHFYYNTEPNTVMNKMYSGSAPYLLNLSTKPASATQICAIVGNPDHTVVSGSGNCFTLPIPIVTSSSLVSSSSNSLISSSVISSSSIIQTSSSIILSSSVASISSASSTSTVLNQNNTGGTITIAGNNNQSSKVSSTSSIQSKQTETKSTETELKSKDGGYINNLKLVLEGDGECSKPQEANIKINKEIKDGTNVYPFGIVNFKVKCDTEVKVKIFYPEVKNWNDWTVRKLIFNKDKFSFIWNNFDVETGFENNVAFIKYSVKDGEYGDNTAKDGYIVDPIGLIQKSYSKSLIEETKETSPIETISQNSSDFILPRSGGVNIGNLTFVVLLIVFVLSLATRYRNERN